MAHWTIEKLSKFLIKQKEGALTGAVVMGWSWYSYTNGLTGKFYEMLGLSSENIIYGLVINIIIGLLVGGLIDAIWKPNE